MKLFYQHKSKKKIVKQGRRAVETDTGDNEDRNETVLSQFLQENAVEL